MQFGLHVSLPTSRDHELVERSSLGKWEGLDFRRWSLWEGFFRSLKKCPLKGLWDVASCGFTLDVTSPSNICFSYCDTFGQKIFSRIQLMLVLLLWVSKTASTINSLFQLLHYNNEERDKYKRILENDANKVDLDLVFQKQIQRQFWWSVSHI